MLDNKLDALVAPSGCPAWLTDLIRGDNSGGDLGNDSGVGVQTRPYPLQVGGLAGVAVALEALDSVRSVARDRRSIDLTVVDAPAALAAIVGAASDAGMSITDVEVARPDLESVFLNLTGRALRD